jgi:hypothetical protein
MALTASATTHVTATPQKVLEFVMNLEEYRKIDKKFVRVVSVSGPDAIWGGLGEALGSAERHATCP